MAMESSELLAPAGDFTTALAAFAAGADAVYCGLSDYSARAFAKNLSLVELKQLLAYAHASGKKVYVTFNTLIEEGELDAAVETLAQLAETQVDALIVQDLGVARLCREHFPELELHASTQLVAHNLEGVLALGELGFRRIVLARELSLSEIETIAKRSHGLELEVFIHGALCYSVSGLCLYSALEKGRSGNRGRCAYCCRLPVEAEAGRQVFPFSMKDLRVGEDVRRLAELGVKSLKIEGRMKSPLYVASVTKYYRQLLSGAAGESPVTVADLETVFSRRTTELYLPGHGEQEVIDAASLGHLGTRIGTLKRITCDREGRRYLRFHTSRALEKHDGLQFAAPQGGKSLGFGIGELRTAFSRSPVFEVPAGTDVEVALPEVPDGEEDVWAQLKSGDAVYCSMSNALKRRFPEPSFRPSDYPGAVAVELKVELKADEIVAQVLKPVALEVRRSGEFAAAKNPERTFAAVEKAFAKLGGTDYQLGRLELTDTERRFAPPSVLNDLRRELVEHLDAVRVERRVERVERVVNAAAAGCPVPGELPQRVVKLRVDQVLPAGEWDEIVVRPELDTDPAAFAAWPAERVRIALPVWTSEGKFNALRHLVRRCQRAGYTRFEAADLATLRLLRHEGVSDLTADFTLYAFNREALGCLVALGVRRIVASPENSAENLAYLAESGYAVEFLRQQSTPLFLSLTRPALEFDARGVAAFNDQRVFRVGELYATVANNPRLYSAPVGRPQRWDLSWSPIDDAL